MLDIIDNEYTLIKPPNTPRMTFILGARCKDGVVLIADKKVTTIDGGLDFDFRNKLFGNLGHIIFGSSGSTDMFELFRAQVMSHVTRNNVSFRDILLVLSENTFALNDRYKFRKELTFDVLVGMQYKDKPSTLTYINAYGLTHEITGFHTIGSGGRYAKVLLRVQDLYDNNMTMKEVAEIGYFIIKYIEYFELDFSVGIDHTGPQIWYIPDFYVENERQEVVRNGDTVAQPSELIEIDRKVSRRLKKHERQLTNLFKS